MDTMVMIREALIPGTNIPMPYTQWMWVTPEQAEGWLRSNTGNVRKVNKRWLEYYVRLINAGEWKIIHQGIAFNIKGKLEDGQHRLAAIVQAKKKLFMPVSWNVPEGQGDAIDCGYGRPLSIRTTLSRRSITFGSFLLRLKYGSGYKVAPDELTKMGKYFHAYIEDLVKYCNTAAPTYTSAPFVSAAIMAVVNGEDRKYVFGLYRTLALRRGEVKQIDPAVAHAICTFVRQNSIYTRDRGQMESFYYLLRFAFEKGNKDVEKLVNPSDDLRNMYREMDMLFFESALANDRPLELQTGKGVEMVSKTRLDEQIKITKSALETKVHNEIMKGMGD